MTDAYQESELPNFLAAILQLQNTNKIQLLRTVVTLLLKSEEKVIKPNQSTHLQEVSEK